MDLGLSPEQALVRATVREFAEREIAPAIGGYVERDAFPEPIVRGLAKLGVFGLPFRTDDGGSGAGMLAFAVALEEIARVDVSVAAIVFAHSSPATILSVGGTPEQKDRWLVPLAEGRLLGAIALTEPSGGSDAAAVRATAVRAPGSDGWVLNGSKTFITNTGTPMDGITVVVARAGDAGLSAFVVPAGTPGYRVGSPLHKIGWRAATTSEVFLDGCCVPGDHLVGGVPGHGLRQALTAISYGRVCVGAIATGLARGAYEQSIAYGRQRRTFGQPLVDRQAIAFGLADLATRIDAARLLTWRAAALADEGASFRTEASMAKLFATETAMRAAELAIQVHGAYGVSREVPVAKLLGDAKVLEIVEGTSEIQRLLLARLLDISTAPAEA
jgi:short/branched chain acyl-CoA dehydrogenase